MSGVNYFAAGQSNCHWTRAEWDPVARRGPIRQSANPYSLDTVLRNVHTLVLAGLPYIVSGNRP
jgi:hypothetical protein